MTWSATRCGAHRARDVHRAELRATSRDEAVLDAGGQPDGAGGRNDPRAGSRLHVQDASGGVDELVPVVAVPVQRGPVGVADGVRAGDDARCCRVLDVICRDGESLPQRTIRTVDDMPNNVVHFAIHADDVERARRFYEAVFGWRFEAWGPPGFYNVRTGDDRDPGIMGALHERDEPLDGKGQRGFTCTVSVDDVAAIRAAVIANGGTITYEEVEIPTVGTLTQFLDTEGNELAAMKYLDGVGLGSGSARRAGVEPEPAALDDRPRQGANRFAQRGARVLTDRRPRREREGVGAAFDLARAACVRHR